MKNSWINPTLVLDRLRLELERLGQYTLEVINKAVPIVSAGSEEELNDLANYRLESEIIENLKNMYFVAMRIANMVTRYREVRVSI